MILGHVQPTGCAPRFEAPPAAGPPPRRVERRVRLEAHSADVWAALTQPASLSTWLGCEVALDVRPGGRGLARREDGAVRRIRVEAVDPSRRLALRWWPYEEPGYRPAGEGTRVEFLLEGDGEESVLTVVESAPEWGAPPGPSLRHEESSP